MKKIAIATVALLSLAACSGGEAAQVEDFGLEADKIEGTMSPAEVYSKSNDVTKKLIKTYEGEVNFSEKEEKELAKFYNCLLTPENYKTFGKEGIEHLSTSASVYLPTFVAFGIVDNADLTEKDWDDLIATSEGLTLTLDDVKAMAPAAKACVDSELGGLDAVEGQGEPTTAEPSGEDAQ